MIRLIIGKTHITYECLLDLKRHSTTCIKTKWEIGGGPVITEKGRMDNNMEAWTETLQDTEMGKA